MCYIKCILGGILRKFLSVAFAAGLVVACAAPTLPLPPPVAPNFSFADVPKGQVHLSSIPNGALPNALIFIYNTNPALPDDERVGGAQADATGTWDATIFGKVGDGLDIYQQDQTTDELSPPLETTVTLH